MSTLMLESRIKPCKLNNGIVFINDEEGVNDLDETPEALDIRADDKAGALIDQYLSWGTDDAEFFGTRKKSLSSKISVIFELSRRLMKRNHNFLPFLAFKPIKIAI